MYAEKIASKVVISDKPSEHVVTSKDDSGIIMRDVITDLDSAALQDNIYSLEHVVTSKDTSDASIADVLSDLVSNASQSDAFYSSEHVTHVHVCMYVCMYFYACMNKVRIFLADPRTIISVIEENGLNIAYKVVRT